MLRPEVFLKEVFGDNLEVWPLSDATIPGSIPAAFNPSLNGTESSLILQNQNIGVDCADRLAPTFQGNVPNPDSLVSLPVGALIAAGAIDTYKGAFFCIGEMPAGAIADGSKRRVMHVRQSNLTNLFDIQKDSAGTGLWYRWSSGGAQPNSAIYPVDLTQKFSVALTWDYVDTQLISFYINGVLVETKPYTVPFTYMSDDPLFSLQQVSIGGIAPGSASGTLSWIGELVYPTFVWGSAPDAAAIQSVHNALVS